MSQNQLPCVFFPLSIVCVDDDENFLNKTAYLLGKKYFSHLYNDPQQALHFLQDYRADSFLNRCVIEPEDQASDKRSLEIDIRPIRNEINNPNRFEEMGVVILDYAMPKLNGGELAKQLKGTPYKIILLTGEADTEIAVKLFNQGVIHSYIRKDNPDFKNMLATTIANLQHEYFQERSAIITNSLAQYLDYPHFWFEDVAFKQLFTQIYQENNLVEFYLLDEYGSYLFLDAEGKPSILAVTTEEMIASYIDYAKNDSSPTKIIEGLESKKIIPFFLSDEDFNVRPAEWGPYLHSAKLLPGRENYYYAYITDPKIYQVGDKIEAYEDFLNKHD